MTDKCVMLPTIDAGQIARSIAQRTTNSNIQAQLLFLPGQYLLATTQGDITTYKLLSPNDLKAAFTGEPVDSGFLSANTIRWGTSYLGEYVVQYYPPQKYGMTLTDIKGGDLVVLTVPMPGLVFMGCGSSYWVWALKEEVSASTQLYHAPLPNVESLGSICFGTLNPNKSSASGMSQIWELLWATPFNSHTVQHKSKKYPVDVRSHLIELHNKKSRKYPVKDLLPLQYNLQEAIHAINSQH